MTLLSIPPEIQDHLVWYHIPCAAFCIGLFYVLLRALFSPLRHIPGPFLARFTSAWYAWEMYRGDFHETNQKLHEKYGPIVRLSPNEYSTSDPEAVKTIYGHNTTFTKGKWYTVWMPPHSPASVFSTQDPAYHAAQRRKFAHAFSQSSVISYEPYVDESTRLMLRLLDKAISASSATKSAVVDLGTLMQYYTLDVVGAVTFGHSFGLMDEGEDTENVIGEVAKRTQYSLFVGLFPWMHRILFPVLTYVMGGVGHGFIARFAKQMMAEKEQEIGDRKTRKMEGELFEDEGPPDLMTKLLARHKEDPEAVKLFDLFSMCNSNIGAGSETTSIFLSSVIYYLAGGGMDGGRSMEKLRKEIGDADERGELSELITWKETKGLHYFQYVLKEAMRMHPVIGFPLPRQANQPTLVAGQIIPAGTEIGINPWVINFDPVSVGEDARDWNPERWADEQAGKRMDRASLNWGMGARSCLGKGIASLEGEKLAAELIRRYDFELDDGLKESIEKCGKPEVFTRAFTRMVEFHVKVKRRA